MQISKEYPMSLPDIDSVMEVDLSIFLENQVCGGFRLLEAAFLSGADTLLPILFFSCSNMVTTVLFKHTKSMNRECSRTLLEGRDILTLAIYKFVSELPESLKADIGDSKCLDVKPCTRKAKYKKLSKLIDPRFFKTQGKHVVKNHLNLICKHCGSSVTKSIDKRREEIWAKIPSCFGYTGWDDAQTKLDELMKS